MWFGRWGSVMWRYGIGIKLIVVRKVGRVISFMVGYIGIRRGMRGNFLNGGMEEKVFCEEY